MLTPTEERRDRPRLPASLMVQYASDSLAFTGVATNLSQTGLFVESELLDLVGTRAWLQLSDGTWNWLNAVGEVVRTVETSVYGVPGMGIRFVELGPGASNWIGRYCETFHRSVRVVVADDDLDRLDRASASIAAAGGRPMCLGPELLTIQAVERLRPHVLILGRGLDAKERLDFIAAMRVGGVVPHGAVYVTGPLTPAEREAARKAGAAGVVGLDDAKGLTRLVVEAARRSAPTDVRRLLLH